LLLLLLLVVVVVVVVARVEKRESSIWHRALGGEHLEATGEKEEE